MSTISRRTFLMGAGAVIAGKGGPGRSATRETLHNGIRLPAPWPPQNRFFSTDPIAPPYVVDPPAIVPIDVGRQLFVDDFLIEDCTLNRTFHQARYHQASPVLRPIAPWERSAQSGNASAMPYSDGVLFDPDDRLFKMWYMAAYGRFTCLALSEDGLQWRRPALNVVQDTNIVSERLRDSSSVWLDLDAADRSVRYKMAAFNGSHNALLFYVSRDGIHWTSAGRDSGPTGDRSTMFYNPFRGVWVFSLRADGMAGFTGRFRRYWETREFGRTTWREHEPVLWMAADRLDPPRSDYRVAPEIYNVDCVAYESVLVGLFTMFRGERPEREKPNDVCIGFSRDGFHWSRPMREPFIGVSERVGDWNWANVQSAGGCCLIVRDELYFYVSGRQGVPGTSEPGICSTGLAVLRRDGFASLTDEVNPNRPTRIWPSQVAQVTTRPVRFSGRHLFVNADLSSGSLRVEVLDREGRAIEPYTSNRSIPVQGADSTKLPVIWAGRPTLQELAGEAVRFRFSLTGGRLYAFWVSPSADGSSRGYVAGGGPTFRRHVDM